jgi:hypothetical protein
MPRKKGVPRLTILIPLIEASSPFETTLASVLQNRPWCCEVVVISPTPYEDPYGLSDEVLFVTAAGANSTAALLNAGLVHVRAPVLHVLGSGCEIDEDWVETSLEHFACDQVAAVCPLVVDIQQPESILAAGVGMSSTGDRLLCGEGKKELDSSTAAQMAGPTLAAGFYRRDFLDLIGGWDASFGDALADLELAMRIRDVGWRTQLDHECLIRSPKQAMPRTTMFAESCHEARMRERLVQRHGAAVPRWRHWGANALEVIAAIPSWRAVVQPIVRWLESRNAADRAESNHRLQEAAEMLVHVLSLPTEQATRPMPSAGERQQRRAA